MPLVQWGGEKPTKGSRIEAKRENSLTMAEVMGKRLTPLWETKSTKELYKKVFAFLNMLSKR